MLLLFVFYIEIHKDKSEIQTCSFKCAVLCCVRLRSSRTKRTHVFVLFVLYRANVCMMECPRDLEFEELFNPIL